MCFEAKRQIQLKGNYTEKHTFKNYRFVCRVWRSSRKKEKESSKTRELGMEGREGMEALCSHPAAEMPPWPTGWYRSSLPSPQLKHLPEGQNCIKVKMLTCDNP